MISSKNQIYLMAFIVAIFATLFCLPFETIKLFTVVVFVILVPFQIILWCLSFERKTKDFLFCLSLLVFVFFLKHLWPFTDSIFYLSAIVIAGLVRYRVFLAIGFAGAALEILREYFYDFEPPEKIAFRYVLFFLAGTVAYLLLSQEKKEKEEIKKELDDLKYGIHQVDEEPVALLSKEGKTSRRVDAALALDEALRNIMKLIVEIFKPDLALFWQYIPEKKRLRVRNQEGNTSDLKENVDLDLGEGPIGWTALNRTPFVKQDLDEVPSFLKKTRIRSLVAVPVLDGERLEGVMMLASPHSSYFPADVTEIIASFAAQVSETIRMTRLAKEREETGIEFQAFYRASQMLSSMTDFEEIIRKLRSLCSEIVQSDFAAIAFLQKEEKRLTLYQWAYDEQDPHIETNLPHDGSSWISWFLQSREEPLIVSSSQVKLQEMPMLTPSEHMEQYASYMAIPMRHQHQCIGSVLLGSEQPDAFTSHQSRILSILGNQAAVSLENASIIKSMEQLATTDGLTGLFNHRYFQDSLDRELERAGRQKQNLSLLILDIDHFKSLNDSFGHPAGDFVLKNLGMLLIKNARKIDVLARYGGEEFAALLPGIDYRNARKTAERWRKAVQRYTFKWEKKSFAITVSIGIAAYPQDAQEKAPLIERADRALYYAKEQGRNQVRHYGEAQEGRLFG